MAKASERMKGTVKWFNDAKGYGFITPTDGGEEMFVHQSAIKADGYRTLAEGETVQFTVAKGDDGRTKAVNVTRPDGGFVQGAGASGGRRNLYGGGGGRGGGDRGKGGYVSGGNGGSWYGARSGGGRTYGGGRGYGGGGRGYGGGGGPCYNCGETGHLASDCYQGGGGGSCPRK